MVPERPKYYGLTAIRRSFGHFVLGKGLSSISSLVVLVIIIRQLSVSEFAVYASLHAVALMLGLLSSLGVNAVLFRFLPELRAAHNNSAMYRLLVIGIVLRVLLYAVAALILFWFADVVGSLLKLGDWLWLLPWYLVVGFLRVNATFTLGVLESLLWQREAQYSLGTAYVFKLVAVSYVAWNGSLSLETFILIECCVELLSLALMLGSAFVRWYMDPARSIGDADILGRDWRRYTRFGLWAYAQNLTSIFHGSAPNRLLISYFMPVATIAVFGTVDRLINYVRRYEPLLTFLGMVRPVFNSRYTGPDDFPKLVSMANCLFRLNLIVLLVPFILFALAGESFFDWLTAGKYADAAGIFLAFYGVLIISSANPMIDVLVKLVEQNRIYAVSNLVMSASLGLAVLLIPHIGLWALALANGAGAIAALAIILLYLKRVGYSLKIDWALITRIVVSTAACVAFGRLVLHAGVPFFAAVALAYAGFFLAIYFWPAFSPDEKALIKLVLRRKPPPISKMSTSAEHGEASRTYGK